MLDTFKKLWENLYTRIGLIVVISLFLLWFLQKTQFAWGCFGIAFTIAYVANPFVSFLERQRFVSRGFGVFLVMLFILSFFTVAVILFIALIIEFSKMRVDLTPIINWVSHLPSWVEQSMPWLSNMVIQNRVEVTQLLENWRQTLVIWGQKGAGEFLRRIGGFFGILLQAGLVFIFTAYILMSFSTITRSMLQFFPPRQQPFMKELGKKLDIAVGGYIRAKIIEALIVGLVVWLSLELIGVPLAFGLGFIAVILNPIPYLGPIFASVPAVILALGTGAEPDWVKALITTVVLLVIQQIDGNIFGPLLMAQSVRIHPVTVLLALLLGSSLFGFWGILLSIPAAAFVQLLYTDYYLNSPWYLRHQRLNNRKKVGNPEV
ncbi:MAG: AI-2E family transporter [Deinococcales bacterium]